MNKVPLIAALSLAVIIIIVVFLQRDPSAILAWDFRVFWTAAGAPLDELYARSLTPFVNPPTALTFLKPLALFDFWIGFMLWTALSLGLFYLAAVRSFSHSVLLLALLSPLVCRAAMLGQMTLLLGAVILWAFSQPGIIAGLALGVVASIKPQLLILAPLAFIVRGDRRMLVGSVIGGSASILLSLALFGADLWRDWIMALSDFRAVLHSEGVLFRSVSPASYAEGFGLLPLPFLLCAIALAAFTIVQQARKLEGGALAALVVACSAFASPYALPHDLVIAVPIAAGILLGPPSVAVIPALFLFTGVFVPFVLLFCGFGLWLRGRQAAAESRQGPSEQAAG